MNMLAPESPESATYSTGIRPWAGSVMAAAAILLVLMLGGLIWQLSDQAEIGMTPQNSIVLMLIILASMLVLMALVVVRL